MKEEFNLSDNLQNFEGWHSKENRFIHISHIKKFLALLKDEFGNTTRGLRNEDYKNALNIIDKLAGDYLI